MYPFINFACGLPVPLFVFHVPFEDQLTVVATAFPLLSTNPPADGLIMLVVFPLAPSAAELPPFVLFQLTCATAGSPADSAAPSAAAVNVQHETAADVLEDVGDDLADATDSVIGDYLSIGPVIYVDQGARVTVMVDRDLEIF